MSDANCRGFRHETNRGCSKPIVPRMDGGAPSLDELLSVLSNRRRRYLLYALVRENRWTDIDAVATQIATWDEADPDVPVADEDDHREEIRRELRHVHVPKLADVGLVEFGPRQETIRRRDLDLAQFEALLTMCAGLDPIDNPLDG